MGIVMRAKKFPLSINGFPIIGGVIFFLLVVAVFGWHYFGATLQQINNSRLVMECYQEIQGEEIELSMLLVATDHSDNQSGISVKRIGSRLSELKDRFSGFKWQEAEKHMPQLTSLLHDLKQSYSALLLKLDQTADPPDSEGKEALSSMRGNAFSSGVINDLEKTLQLLDKVSTTLGSYADSATATALSSTLTGRRNVLAVNVFGFAVVAFLFLLFTRSNKANTRQMVHLTDDLANGNMMTRFPVGQKDEMGQLAGSANILAVNLNQICIKVHGSSSTINVSSASLDRLSAQMFTAADEMSGNSNTVAAAAEQMNANMSAIAASSEQASTNVGMVAAAAEQMTATISEIASGAEKARVITEKAVAESHQASISVKELGEAAQKIGKVTEAINEIAEQTNLLALNATIESARAGEAGKGFAVVANEIKDLAKQTTEATREIQERIEGVQKSSEQTILVINTIADIINNTNELVSSIAAAVEEQAVTSREIANNVGQASVGIQEVSENITQASTVNAEVTRDIALIKKEAESVAGTSSDIKELASEMKANAAALDLLLEKFTFKRPPFDIGRIKDAHFNWKMRLTSVLNGYASIDPKNIPDHHHCDFGKWYDSASQSLKSLSVFEEIGIHHEAVHRKAVEVVNCYNSNNESGAESVLQEFEKERKALFAALDELYVSH
jgi:methyl-accepting chemotaxis protein